jgi:hypothetical protein
MIHDASSYLVGCHLSIPAVPAGIGLCPTGNHIGAIILTALVRRAWGAAGIEIFSSAGWGELNNVTVVGFVRQRHEALRSLQEVFRECGLLAVSEIGWFDPDEGIYRTAWPANGQQDFGRFLRTEMIEAAMVEATERVAALLAWESRS